ncbi:MAG: hypothetical protein HC927_03900 [Deltaproteobacteria bacterium]|nr:hypothetical protein [Deltaproteobacteria bacterium]
MTGFVTITEAELPQLLDRVAAEGWTEFALSKSPEALAELSRSQWEFEHLFLLPLDGNFEIVIPRLRACPRLARLSLTHLGLSLEDIRLLAGLAGLKRLDLNNNGIGSEGVEELEGLRRLTSLSLSGNLIDDQAARALARFQGLTTLNLGDNAIGDAGALALARLRDLGWLSLNQNFIHDTGAEALVSLCKLYVLDLSYNQVGDVGARAIGRLDQLVNLFLSHNDVGNSGARGLATLTKLTFLNLRNNRIEDQGLRALAALPNLAYLDISNNPISPSLQSIVANRNAQEIFAAARRFITAPAEPLNEAKLVVLGNEAVGKTSLVRYLVHGTPRSPDEQKTVGIAGERIETQSWSPAGKGPRLNVWDFGGQEIMHQTHKFFLTERSIYLLVLEDRREDDTSVHPWLRTIANRSGDSPILIVINKSDGGRENLRLNETEIMREWPAVVGIVRTSCNDDDWARASIDALKRKLVDILNQHPKLEHVRASLPSPWRRIKDEVATRASQNKILTRRDFERLCESADDPKHAVTDPAEQRALLRLLHDLGVIVAHGFDRRATAVEQAVTLLDPNWLTGAIYKILTSNKVALQGGVFAHAELRDLLDPGEYAGTRAEFVLQMMAHPDVGLCFPLPESRGEQYLVPEALPVNEPYSGKWPGDVLRLRYAYKHLPRGLVPRFIVEAHEKLATKGARWRTGAVLEVFDCPVLVRASVDDKQIDIWVDGPAHRRRGALDYVRDKFKRVHALNPEAKPEELVPLPDNPGGRRALRSPALARAQRGPRTQLLSTPGRS